MLEQNSDIVIAWFEINYMKLITDKCHLLVFGYHIEELWVRVSTDKIMESKIMNLQFDETRVILYTR